MDPLCKIIADAIEAHQEIDFPKAKRAVAEGLHFKLEAGGFSYKHRYYSCTILNVTMGQYYANREHPTTIYLKFVDTPDELITAEGASQGILIGGKLIRRMAYNFRAGNATPAHVRQMIAKEVLRIKLVRSLVLRHTVPA